MKAYYNRPDISFRKNYYFDTAEASEIEDTFLFKDNLYNGMKYHWIDYFHAFSI